MLTVGIETITPEYARQVLSVQDKRFHRKVRKHRVSQYARLILEGRWRLNCQTLSFSGDRVMNGIHRLLAVDAAGVPVPFIVVRGLEPDVFPTIDTGGIRSQADTMHIAQISNSTQVSAVATLLWYYDSFGNMQSQPQRLPSRAEVLEYVEDHAEIHDAARWARSGQNHVLSSATPLAAVYALCANRPVERDVFFGDFQSGINLSTDSPVRVLRERLLRDRGSRVRLPSFMVAALIIKAWNAELRGEPMRLLRWTATEAFPWIESRHPECATNG